MTLRGPVEVINRKNPLCIRVVDFTVVVLLGVGRCSFTKSLSFFKKARVSRKEDLEKSLLAVEGC